MLGYTAFCSTLKYFCWSEKKIWAIFTGSRQDKCLGATPKNSTYFWLAQIGIKNV